MRDGDEQHAHGVGTDHVRSPPTRPGQHPLKGSLGKRSVNEKNLDQWQYEVTGAGRIWYCIDDDTRTIRMTDASVGHPKATE